MLKMSKMATPPIMDPHTANILICYLLYKIDKPVRVNHLYDIAVGSDIINYFAYQDSISYLLEHDSVELRRRDGETEYYVLTENGIRTAIAQLCGKSISGQAGFRGVSLFRPYQAGKRSEDQLHSAEKGILRSRPVSGWGG